MTPLKDSLKHINFPNYYYYYYYLIFIYINIFSTRFRGLKHFFRPQAKAVKVSDLLIRKKKVWYFGPLFYTCSPLIWGGIIGCRATPVKAVPFLSLTRKYYFIILMYLCRVHYFESFKELIKYFNRSLIVNFFCWNN